MKKVPRKIYLEHGLTNVLDKIAEHYEISKTVLVEELLFASLFPEDKPIRILLIENDEYFKGLLQDFNKM